MILSTATQRSWESVFYFDHKGTYRVPGVSINIGLLVFKKHF